MLCTFHSPPEDEVVLLALADIFFFVARFFQKTKKYEFVLPGGPGSVDLIGDPKERTAWAPYPYRLIF